MIPTIHTSGLLDRQSHKRGDAAHLAALAAHGDARFLVLTDMKPVIRSNAERTEASLRWFTPAELASAGLPTDDPLFLGVVHDTGPNLPAGRFALAFSEHRVNASPPALSLFRPAVDLRTLAMQGAMSTADLSLCGQAKALFHWHDNARCCGRCGAVMHVKEGGWKRKCWACGHDQFPRTDPVVIMLIVHPDGHSCLLGAAPRFQNKMFSTLAGFVEPGEDIADAVRRETLEEANIEVGEVRFHSSQPWPFPHSLMIGCIGQATTSAITIDPVELLEARWFSREECLQLLEGRHPDGLTSPGRQAIARYLIKSFVEDRG